MSRCGSNCASDCRRACGHDHSSKAERLPNLLSVEVVEGIFSKACGNMRVRFEAEAAGELSREAHEERTEALIEWLCITFAGENPHFEPADEWLPAGLADYLRETKAEQLGDAVRGTDADVVAAAVEGFVSETRAVLAFYAVNRPAQTLDDFLAEHASRWARIFTGMFD